MIRHDVKPTDPAPFARQAQQAPRAALSDAMWAEFTQVGILRSAAAKRGWETRRRFR